LNVTAGSSFSLLESASLLPLALTPKLLLQPVKSVDAIHSIATNSSRYEALFILKSPVTANADPETPFYLKCARRVRPSILLRATIAIGCSARRRDENPVT
jgi:hypothetical protein